MSSTAYRHSLGCADPRPAEGGGGRVEAGKTILMQHQPQVQAQLRELLCIQQLAMVAALSGNAGTSTLNAGLVRRILALCNAFEAARQGAFPSCREDGDRSKQSTAAA